jgi:tetratricopeptide (TPR) repeat protein
MAENDAVFQEAVEALREGKKAHARELLTGLLKTDQNNATYWVWMSAAMETPKERIYCLQTALKLDPNNDAAKRGLILHGALPADDSVQPFPVNRPRTWEQKLLLAHEKPKPKGWAAIKASPVARIGGLVALGVVVIALVVFGFITGTRQATQAPTRTPGPSPTYTLTPTALGAVGVIRTVGTPDPLSELLAVPYTPTPLHITIPNSPQTTDLYRSARLSYTKEAWDDVIRTTSGIIQLEPNSPVAYYLMGDAYRFKGDFSDAINAYQLAISLDSEFAPAYLGLARARLGSDPNTDVRSFLDEAIRFDPDYGEAYLERANARIQQNDIPGALNDLAKADSHLPDSPLVYLALAQARLKDGDLKLALQAAEHANQLDVTNLPAYLLLGQLYAQTDQPKEAADALNTYLKYRPNDSAAYLLLGKMDFQNGDYESTVANMEKSIALNRNQREPYQYLFLSNVELGRGDEADQQIDQALLFYPNSFDVRLGIVRLHLLQKRNGSALLELDKAKALAETDEQKAQLYYWGAMVYEKRNDPKRAAQYWQDLLDLPEDVMTPEMRTEAEQHLAASNTATPTRKSPTRTPTRTATSTRTPAVSQTPTRTPTP